jgi:hypothetical protein
MNRHKAEHPGALQRRDSPLLFVLYFLAYLSVLIRMILRPPSEGLIGLPAYGLMAAFLVRSIAQLPIGRRWPALTHVHLVLQCGIVILLLLTRPLVDYYAVLCVGLSIVAVRDLPARWDLAWLGILCAALSLGLIAVFGLEGGASYIPISPDA